ncbi:putative UDP-glucuronosyltransferase 2A3 [Xylogone sp. PMI_703]|nr:putative UDP-glucuronosyltransferase 2A3 [Xylogone sp. PMI_703]
MAESIKPILLIASLAIYGHVMPMRAVAKALIARGYQVYFLTGNARRAAIESIGARFVPLDGYADFTESDFSKKWPTRNTLPPGLAKIAWDMEHIFINSIPSQHEGIQRAMALIAESNPGAPVIALGAQWFFGSLVSILNAPRPHPSAWITIGISVLGLSSIDTAPFGLGLLPDSSPEGRKRNAALNEEFRTVMHRPQQRFVEILHSLDARPTSSLFFDLVYTAPSRFIQMCTPGVEYVRSDAPTSIRFSGGLPPGNRDSMQRPLWWDEITANTECDAIVLVSQGSVAVNYQDLVVPTIEALKSRPKTKVIVALGSIGAVLPAAVKVPPCVRVIDFVPFDEVLPYCDVFITNGGYGAFQHAVSNGTPVVIGGSTEDKPEVAARAEWAGFGVNLRTGNPRSEDIGQAVERILRDPKYKKRAMELKLEMDSFDWVTVICQNIDELV